MESPSFVDMAVRLRQDGWQLITATTIDQATYRAELRLQHWHQITSAETTEPSHEIKAKTPIRRALTWLINLFLKMFVKTGH